MTLPHDLSDARVLADFAGAWRLARRIEMPEGAVAQFDGQAEWRWQGDDLAYLERGLLDLGVAKPVQAERRMLWRADLGVWFDDGRYFHHVPARGGAVAHDCPPDTYSGFYDFSGWPDFALRWKVTGPRKSYVSTSVYTRGDPAV